ncbi:MAG: endopeptidase La [Sphaerochaetaceae bacterium]|jgi:ATP-dependent Lon protease|nr:endopeptidase La [Sphaerochaetaceae bacterium]NLO60139.1 endopeptidase La [Spirochaetales bacterium]MDD2405365.1 endopeptidase La [Sphaerochaetaceae bacterium]MDD3670560.1 endopeptidase La [Sphaerochaetaceae bacterium]MDD4840931.1 endopeptidase La [Sphaerochaetaceae bacterium]
MADQELMPVEQTLPHNLFILPLVGNPIFPGLFTPLVVESREDIEIVSQAMAHGGDLGLLLVKDDSKVEYDPENLYRVGTIAKIIKRIKLPDGGMNIFISTLKRFQVKEFHTSGNFIVAEVQYLDDIEDNPQELKAWTRQLITEMKRLSKGNPLFTEEMRLNMVNIDQAGKMADFIASIINVDRRQQQRILETLNVRRRMERVLVFIKKEQQLLAMQEQIQNRVNSKLEKNQREYFLREELKHIQQELGMTTDPRTATYNKIAKQIAALDLQGEVLEAVTAELEKFQTLDPNSPEYSIIRTYLETVAALPWKEPEPENYSLDNAKKILERDHYGLKDVKDRILEYLAVRKKKQDTKGSIICLVGPPGVGKTSVGRSIARALKKEYFRFSVGGMRDEAEIKGHRRTYIGAMPGKIIQGLKTVKSKNPVFLIDEIDKMGSSYQGDPASALLEVLDPEQNVTFRDYYLDLPFDISEILFIVTANSLETIPRPLLDRMEIIQISGYTTQEKLAIGKKYLVPKSLKKHGLTKKEISYTSKILLEIAESYAREAGVRNYEKSLDKIHRKVAREILEHDPKLPVAITRDKMIRFLGQPIFYEDEILRADRPGMAIGLAWTSMGGDTLAIEAVAYPGKGDLKLTGKLGEVMQESAAIALTHIKSISTSHGIDPVWFDTHSIHLHVPEGATPKDGPSAGITMATALYSLITNTCIRPNLAMTGELDLVGKVMPIGGLKEKVLAARRNNIETILIPKFNKRDLEELEKEVTEGLNFHLVGSFEEVLKHSFAVPEAKG